MERKQKETRWVLNTEAKFVKETYCKHFFKYRISLFFSQINEQTWCLASVTQYWLHVTQVSKLQFFGNFESCRKTPIWRWECASLSAVYSCLVKTVHQKTKYMILLMFESLSNHSCLPQSHRCRPSGNLWSLGKHCLTSWRVLAGCCWLSLNEISHKEGAAPKVGCDCFAGLQIFHMEDANMSTDTC